MPESTTNRACSEAVLRELVYAGTLAPSGDNTQPWKFEIDPAESRITVSVDPTRDTSPMNAGQRMARIAVGCAVENIVQNSRRFRAFSKQSRHPSGRCHNRFFRIGRRSQSTFRMLIRQRCTNRRFYDGSSVCNPVLEDLIQSTQHDEIPIHWVVDRDEIRRLAQLIRRADTLLFSNHAMRNAFLENIRFDRPAKEPVTEGLSLGSLEASAAEANALKLLTKLPNWAAHLLRVGPGIGRKSQRLVESSSGICIGFAPDREIRTDLQVGCAMQNSWLELTERGFAVQPMMSVPFWTTRMRDAGFTVRKGKRLRGFVII